MNDYEFMMFLHVLSTLILFDVYIHPDSFITIGIYQLLLLIRGELGVTVCMLCLMKELPMQRAITPPELKGSALNA